MMKLDIHYLVKFVICISPSDSSKDQRLQFFFSPICLLQKKITHEKCREAKEMKQIIIIDQSKWKR